MTIHIEINSVQDTASLVAAPLSAVRGSWGEILHIEGPDGATQAADIIRLFSSVLPESYADYDRKLRGDSLNLDLYGYDPEQGVAVIQLRHASRRHANWYMRVRKPDPYCENINPVKVLKGLNTSEDQLNAKIRGQLVPLAQEMGAERAVTGIRREVREDLKAARRRLRADVLG